MTVLRLLRIALEILRYALGNALQRIHLLPSKPKPPERLRLGLERLGTTFIKFGQALSIRRDMLSDEYVVALQSLQDRVSPFPARDAIQEIETGLGRPTAELFAEFDEAPLAAASVAQVHTARLHDGREVIVKVRRAGLKSQIDRDMRALYWLARVVIMLVPRLRHYQPLRIVNEIGGNLAREIDFRREAQNIKRFVVAFAEWPTLMIPDVIDGFVCETVIVQERSPGLRIDDPAVRPDGPRLARNFVEAYLHQIFVLGAFHGDPHPGNLFLTKDGRICFHDFGLIGFLDRATRRELAAFTSAFIRQDADWLLDAAIDLGVLGGEMDRGEFRRGLAEILADYVGLPLKDWSLAEAFLRVTRLGQAQNVFVPLNLLILMRAMFLAENAVRVLDPDFQLLDTLQTKGSEALKAAMENADWRGTLERLNFDALTAAHDLPPMVRVFARQLLQEGGGPGLSLNVRELKGVNEHIDRGSNRLALSLVTLGLYIAGSLLMQHSIGPRIFGDFPLLAAFAYAIALWFTFRIARGIARSGRL
ncbi:AarF/ABC1/UbiB kinase family protein [Mesorhizobium sp. M4B.F.Ca.ET.049.02.1.2]|nr:AarF/ABC1/UbiB kinase family protein [Mesorhizobium sp. M4B.F.Ca.ET.049.02.1.2]